MHIGDGMMAVIVEGEAHFGSPTPDLARTLAEEHNRKYSHYGMKATPEQYLQMGTWTLKAQRVDEPPRERHALPVRVGDLKRQVRSPAEAGFSAHDGSYVRGMRTRSFCQRKADSKEHLFPHRLDRDFKQPKGTAMPVTHRIDGVEKRRGRAGEPLMSS
jgi:hypothetical protein